jgi:hypothetical protein
MTATRIGNRTQNLDSRYIGHDLEESRTPGRGSPDVWALEQNGDALEDGASPCLTQFDRSETLEFGLTGALQFSAALCDSVRPCAINLVRLTVSAGVCEMSKTRMMGLLVKAYPVPKRWTVAGGAGRIGGSDLPPATHALWA